MNRNQSQVGRKCNRSHCHITAFLSRINAGDPAASHELLPLVYEELRKLAAARMAREAPGQTLQATALVHEAYLRPVKDGGPVVLTVSTRSVSSKPQVEYALVSGNIALPATMLVAGIARSHISWRF